MIFDGDVLCEWSESRVSYEIDAPMIVFMDSTMDGGSFGLEWNYVFQSS